MPRRQPTPSGSDSRARTLVVAVLAAAPAVLVAVNPLACAPSAFTADEVDGSSDAGVIPVVVVMPDAGGPDGDAGDSGSCVPTGTGALGVPGCPCSTAGAAACAGNAQNQALLCQGGLWAAGRTCPDGQLCDTRSGATQGTCVAVVSSCAGAEAGQAVCADPLTVAQCGVDLVSATVVTSCSQQTCLDGGCAGSCGPLDKTGTPSRQCVGNVLQQCTDAATWADLRPCALCCGSDCIDPTNTADPNVARNCGRCGHDCQQGACASGVCAPVSLGSVGDAGLLSGPLAIDEHDVYATTSDGVVAGSLAGSAQTLQPIVSGRSGGNPFGIATAAGNVYWTEPPNGLVMGVGGGLEGGAPFTVASGQILPNWLAADDEALYWSVADTASGGGVVALALSGALDGGAPTTLFSGTFPVTGLAVDPSGLYFAQAGCHLATGATVCSDAISRLPPGAGDGGDAAAPTFLASDRPANWLVVQGPGVYWTSIKKCTPTDAGVFCPGTIESVGIDGGAPALVGSTLNLGGPLVADDAGLYLVGQVAVLAQPLDGAAATSLATGIAPAGIAQSAAMLYWTDPVLGQIGKVTKP